MMLDRNCDGRFRGFETGLFGPAQSTYLLNKVNRIEDENADFIWELTVRLREITHNEDKEAEKKKLKVPCFIDPRT